MPEGKICQCEHSAKQHSITGCDICSCKVGYKRFVAKAEVPVELPDVPADVNVTKKIKVEIREPLRRKDDQGVAPLPGGMTLAEIKEALKDIDKSLTQDMGNWKDHAKALQRIAKCLIAQKLAAHLATSDYQAFVAELIEVL